jgi:hypothetical protein
MDDPTLRCENDAGSEMHLSGLPIPSGGPIFLAFFPQSNSEDKRGLTGIGGPGVIGLVVRVRWS